MTTARSTPVPWKNVYPTSHERPMAETHWHCDLLANLIQTLRVWYTRRPRVYVWGNLLLFYGPGNRGQHVSPDVFVVKGIDR